MSLKACHEGSATQPRFPRPCQAVKGLAAHWRQADDQIVDGELLISLKYEGKVVHRAAEGFRIAAVDRDDVRILDPDTDSPPQARWVAILRAQRGSERVESLAQSVVGLAEPRRVPGSRVLGGDLEHP